MVSFAVLALLGVDEDEILDGLAIGAACRFQIDNMSSRDSQRAGAAPETTTGAMSSRFCCVGTVSRALARLGRVAVEIPILEADEPGARSAISEYGDPEAARDAARPGAAPETTTGAMPS